MAGTVWILGAGFSIPLGAPSLRDLISDSTRLQAVRVLTQEQAAWAYTVQHVYEWGVRGPAGRAREAGVGLWRDPEEYLELMELAMSDGGSHVSTLIVQYAHNSAPPDSRGVLPDSPERRRVFLERLHQESVRFCAAACSTFLAQTESDPRTLLETERWEPYVRWKRKKLVALGDTVITFNWDRVLDLVRNHGGTELSAVLPADLEFPDADIVPVLHVHGHVTWQRDESSSSNVLRHQDSLAAVKHPESAVLGTPGGSKKTTSETLLAPLWKAARAALMTADCVVFIGYRFPPSDNMSKRVLLGALKQSTATRIHVVLGPRSEDAPRLQGLLKWADPENGPGRRIAVHELGTEDFLSVVEKRHL